LVGNSWPHPAFKNVKGNMLAGLPGDYLSHEFFMVHMTFRPFPKSKEITFLDVKSVAFYI
jgi:hypothetical protein